VDDGLLLERNVCGLVALHRLVGRHAGTLVELDGAVGSIVPTAPRYPWLNAGVCEPGGDIRTVLEQVLRARELDPLVLWACGPEQTTAARAGGIPADRVSARGHQDADGRVLAAGVFLDVVRLYRRLGYRAVGELALLARPGTRDRRLAQRLLLCALKLLI
jgi:hypothetical protein